MFFFLPIFFLFSSSFLPFTYQLDQMEFLLFVYICKYIMYTSVAHSIFVVVVKTEYGSADKRWTNVFVANNTRFKSATNCFVHDIQCNGSRYDEFDANKHILVFR